METGLPQSSLRAVEANTSPAFQSPLNFQSTDTIFCCKGALRKPRVLPPTSRVNVPRRAAPGCTKADARTKRDGSASAPVLQCPAHCSVLLTQQSSGAAAHLQPHENFPTWTAPLPLLHSSSSWDLVSQGSFGGKSLCGQEMRKAYPEQYLPLSRKFGIGFSGS